MLLLLDSEKNISRSYENETGDPNDTISYNIPGQVIYNNFFILVYAKLWLSGTVCLI